jgi:hypothetical protein
MRRFWDSLGAIIIAVIVVKLLFDALKPYIPFFSVGLVVYVLGTFASQVATLVNKERS